MQKDITKDPFPEYYKLGEPEKEYKAYAWSTAIGLQAVDGLMPSDYLIDVAKKNIDGKISFDDAKELLDSYYKENPQKDNERYEEADKVSQRIAKILSEKAFTFNPETYISIHRRLFENIYTHAGKIRTYNITKSEWVLDGDTVIYGNALDLRANLEYDIQQEIQFSYDGLSGEQLIHHLAIFVAHLWQNHIFSEGNTRTTAVFFIKYLRQKGFNVTNDLFAKHAWYFRNALVRANYNNSEKEIYETTEFLELFLENLLLGKFNELHNRTMHISGKFRQYKISENPTIQTGNPTIQTGNPTIQTENPTIGDTGKTEFVVVTKKMRFNYKTINYIRILYNTFGVEEHFGRKDVENTLHLASTTVYELLRKLQKQNMIYPIQGKGKGKYRFNKLFFNESL